MKIFKFLAAALLVLTFTNIHAQEIWQVDVRTSITARKSGGYTILSVNVKADNDDTARSPKLIVSLPRNCKVTSVNLEAGFKNTPYEVKGNGSLGLSHNPEKTDGVVVFDIRNLNKEAFNVQITIEPTSAGYKPKSMATAYAYSLTPDGDPRNNFSSCVTN